MLKIDCMIPKSNPKLCRAVNGPNAHEMWAHEYWAGDQVDMRLRDLKNKVGSFSAARLLYKHMVQDEGH